MSATRASRVQPFGRATLGRSPKDLAKPYLDRKYKSVQTRQYLLGGFGVDPGHWSLNRAHTDAASGVTVAVDTVMAAEKVEEVLVTKLATAGVETLAVAALEKGGEGRTGLVLAEKKVEECGGKNCRAAGMAACKDKGGLEDFSFVVNPGIRAWFGHKLHFKAGLCFNKLGALVQVQSSNFSQMAIKQVCRDLARTLCENSLCCHNFAFVCLGDQGDCTSKKIPLLPRDLFEVSAGARIQKLPSTRLQFTLKTIQKRHVKLYVMKIVSSM